MKRIVLNSVEYRQTVATRQSLSAFCEKHEIKGWPHFEKFWRNKDTRKELPFHAIKPEKADEGGWELFSAVKTAA